MATVYKKTFTKPLPEGAEFFTRRGQRFARWKDAKGKTRTAATTTGRDGADRILIEAATYTAKYRDGGGIVREVSTGCRSKDAALSVLKDLTDRAERVKAGILTPTEAAVADQQGTPLAAHIDAYLTHLRVTSASASHLDGVQIRLRRLMRDCCLASLRDVTRDAMERWLADREAEGMAPRTRNSYVIVIRALLNWCVKTKRLIANPLAEIALADENAGRRRQRRAMTDHELRQLLYVARWRPLAEYGRETVKKDRGDVKGKRDTWNAAPLTFDGIDAAVERARDRLKDNSAFVAELDRRGRERALVYKTLVLTGLRRGELASLTVGQLHLDGPVAYASLDAAAEKNRKGSEIPLRGDLAADLRGWLADRLEAARHAAGGPDGQTVPMGGLPAKLPPATPLFNVPRQLVKTLNRDLAAAGIAKTDDRGRTLDVHALRHTFGTHLSKGGVAPRTAQAAMRHSTIDLTMNVYTDPRLLDVGEALAVLPQLPLDKKPLEGVGFVLSATGTDANRPSPLAPTLAPTTGKRCKSVTNPDNRRAECDAKITNSQLAVSGCPDKRKPPLSAVVMGWQRVEPTGLEPATPGLQSAGTTLLSEGLPEVAPPSPAACTTACTNLAENVNGDASTEAAAPSDDALATLAAALLNLDSASRAKLAAMLTEQQAHSEGNDAE